MITVRWFWTLVSLLLISESTALPLVDAGLFVILGVSTCRDGTGYCLLGSDCTLDHDFSPDDSGGHCNGLRAAFTPAANFVCCKYNGADTKTTTTTMRSTSLPPLITTPENKPSRRPVINGGGSIKPQSTDNAGDTPGAIFWVDLASDGTKPNNVKYGAQNTLTKLGETHPGSTLTVAGNVVSDASVPIKTSANIENWLKPGVTMYVPSIIASNPGSTVTVANKDDLLNGIIHGVSSEVVHGVSITQHDEAHPTPSLSIQLDLGDSPSMTDGLKPSSSVGDEIGEIEHHEFNNQQVEAETSDVRPESLKPDLEVEISSVAPVAPLASTAKPTTAASEEDEDEDEDEDDSEEEDEEDEDDGLFGLTDLVDFLGFETQKKDASGILGKNMSDINGIESKLGDHSLPSAGIDTEHDDNLELEDDLEEEIESRPEERIDNATDESSNLVGGFLDITTLPAVEDVTEPAQSEDEEPPLCLGPVREPRDPACWAVNFESRVNGTSKSLCSGARVTRDLVVTSASCAVRVFMAGVKETRAVVPSEDDSDVTEVIVHESYRAAPHMSLHDIGLVRLRPSSKESDMGKCTLCLPQDSRADFSHIACHSPRYSTSEQVSARAGDNSSAHAQVTVELEPRTTSARGLCESVTRARTEDDSRFPTFLCSAPARINKQQVSRVPNEGIPLVCSGRRSIPVLAGVVMTSQHDANDWTLYTPMSHYVEWIRANQIPEMTVSSGTLTSS